LVDAGLRFAPIWERYWIEPDHCDDGEVYADVHAMTAEGDAIGFMVRSADGWELVMR
jgi:hypothetical protein